MEEWDERRKKGKVRKKRERKHGRKWSVSTVHK